jgi:hypothetical protein
MAPESSQPNRLSHTAIWRLHRFTRAAVAADSARSLDEDVRAFFEAVVEQFAGEGYWMPAAAPARGGGVDVWFRLPVAPADANFSVVWARLLTPSGLASHAISGRN